MFFAGLNSVIADSPGFEGFSQELIWPAAGHKPNLQSGAKWGSAALKVL